MRYKEFFTLLIFFGLAVFAFSFRNARAYSIYDGSSGQTISIGGGLDSLISPFSNFFRNVNSVGALPPRISPPSLSLPALPNTFNQFDTWLYGIAGFHIGAFLTAILNILSWILGAVKGVVDWLLGLIGR